jgi:hypothetical protein
MNGRDWHVIVDYDTIIFSHWPRVDFLTRWFIVRLGSLWGIFYVIDSLLEYLEHIKERVR